MHAALPAGRLLPVCVGACLRCVMIHFVYSGVPGDSQVDSGHGPKIPQAEDRLLNEVFSAYFATQWSVVRTKLNILS